MKINAKGYMWLYEGFYMFRHPLSEVVWLKQPVNSQGSPPQWVEPMAVIKVGFVLERYRLGCTE